MEKARSFIKANKKTFILIGTVVLGGIVGAIWGEGASVLKPFGTLFINMSQAIVVPLVFLTVATSIGSIKTSKKVGKLISTIMIVLIVMSVLAACFAYLSSSVQLVDPAYAQKLIESYDETVENTTGNIGLLENFIGMISTDDFSKLLSKSNMLALLLMSVLTGISIQKTLPKSQKLLEVFESATEVMLKLVQLIMYYAPFGLACYFADFIGEFGADIAEGYLRVIIVFTIVTVVTYFAFYSIIVLAASGRNGLKLYWKSIIVPSVTAISTISSIATIPFSTEAAINMGVSKDVANTTIPLGVSFHKGGTLMGKVMLAVFAAALFGRDVSGFTIISAALLVTLMVAGTPAGAGGAANMMLLSIIGCPLSIFPLLSILGQILDLHFTLLNVAGNNVAAVVVNRVMNGKTPNKRGKISA